VTLIDAEPDQETPRPARRHPSTIGGACFLVLLAVTIFGIGLTVVSDEWRLGVRVIAGSLLALAGLRLVLPEREAGMLAVRGRMVDVTLVAATGAALLVLAASVPDQPVM
jgi:hypothetical protein